MTRAGVSHGDGDSDVKRDGRCRPHRRRLARVGTQCVALAWCRRSAGVPLPISLAVVSWLATKSGTSPHERRFFRTVLKADTMAERALQVVASAVTGWCHRYSVAGARPVQGETGTSIDGRLKYRVQVGGVLAHGGTPPNGGRGQWCYRSGKNQPSLIGVTRATERALAPPLAGRASEPSWSVPIRGAESAFCGRSAMI